MVGQRVWAFILLLSLLALASPAAAASEDMANVMFEAATAAPVVAMAAALDARDVLAVDQEARFTFLGEMGDVQRTWQAPNMGHLAALDPTLGEVKPSPVGVSVVPDGSLWAGAVAYDDAFPGRVYGFGHWSDTPIWTYTLPQPPANQDADQPVMLTGGGPYYALGTAKGNVILLTAEADSGTTKQAHRTYKQDNQGNAFGRVNDVALSRNGTRILIATDATGHASLHLFSDTFFLASFRRIQEPVYDVAVSADGTRGIAITGTGASTRAHFLDLDNGTTLWETSLGAAAGDMALSPDGHVMAIGTRAGNLLVFEETGGMLDREPVAKHYVASPVTAVGIADNGHALAAATDGGVVYYFDTTRPTALWSHDLEAPLVSLALAGDEEVLALGAADGDTGRIIVTGAKHDLAYLAPPQPRLLPGVANTLNVEVANNGNRLEHIQVVAKNLPKGWETTPATLTLAPGEQRTAPVEILVSKGQRDGGYDIRIEILSAAATLQERIATRVPEVASARVSETWTFDHAVPGGAPAAYLLTIENLGNVPNQVALGYAGLPAGWKADFEGALEFRLQPGEDRQVTMLVFAPRDAVVGREAWFDLVLAGQHGEWKTSVTILVTDGPSYNYALRVGIDSPDRDPDAVPLQEALRERIEKDLEEAKGLEAQKKAAAVKKANNKDSPGIGLAPLLALVGLGALVLRRRVVISSPTTRAERWCFPELLHEPEGLRSRLHPPLAPAQAPSLGSYRRLRFHDGREEHDDARDPPHGRRKHG